MRFVIFLTLVLVGCASPRDKDCKDLLPRVDAAHAKPSPETVAGLRAFEAHEPLLREPAKTYATAVDRQVLAAKAIDQLVAALKMRKGEGPKFSVDMFEPSRPHAERLIARCLPSNAPPDCALLGSALAACVTPKADDTTMEEQLLTCAAGFAAVKSEDAATNESIQALARAMRDLEPFARNVGAPAKEVIRVAKEVSPRVNDANKARADANAAEIEIRSICAGGQPGARAGTRGPS